MNKKVVILGGGTISHVRNHLALSAPAYGTIARKLADLCREHSDKLDVVLALTKMADTNSQIETIEDVEDVVGRIISDKSIKIVFFNIAMVDFKGHILDGENVATASGKKEGRLNSSDSQKMLMIPSEKIISSIRKSRKDIFLVGFKTTCGATPQEQYLKGLNLLKKSSCNLVLANDTKTYNNMIITPEEAAYHETTDRDEVLKNLVEIAYLRSHLMFTRSFVVAGESVEWDSESVPSSLRAAVDFCIKKGAYKKFMGSTVGHFAVKLDDTTFLTSKRKTNFNDLSKIGLVKVQTNGPDEVTAYGFKPSVGGQSQRIIFNQFAEHKLDCIVHFHCPLKENHTHPIKVMSQREYECGSHECGQNTADGLTRFGNLWAVMLDKHGPNIVFNRDINPKEVIEFIEANFDLSSKTGGYMLDTIKSYGGEPLYFYPHAKMTYTYEDRN